MKKYKTNIIVSMILGVLICGSIYFINSGSTAVVILTISGSLLICPMMLPDHEKYRKSDLQKGHDEWSNNK
jgi:hypothetical protein